MAKATRQFMALDTASEHEALLAVQQQLERDLTRAARGREHEWAAQVSQSVGHLHELLRSHVRATEGPGGLLAEIQTRLLSVNERLVDVRTNHRNLLKECDRLLYNLARYATGATIPFAELRHELTCLLIELHHHRALEADLVFEAFDLEVGAVD